VGRDPVGSRGDRPHRSDRNGPSHAPSYGSGEPSRRLPEETFEDGRSLDEQRLTGERPPERWPADRKPAEGSAEPEDNFGVGIFS
jgi:hypothetical protein